MTLPTPVTQAMAELDRLIHDEDAFGKDICAAGEVLLVELKKYEEEPCPMASPKN
jgi:hypothetical protein